MISEKRIEKIVKNVLNEFVNKTGSKYEVLNAANSSIVGQRKNHEMQSLHFVAPRNENTILNEGIDFEVPQDERGGTIVFSTDINAVEMSSNSIVNFIKQKFSTILNRFKATNKIDKIANKHDLVGWTIGHYFDGRYKSKSRKNFGENSLTIDVVGVNDKKMIEIAEDVCSEFQQECVLLRLHNGRILFVNPSVANNR